MLVLGLRVALLVVVSSSSAVVMDISSKSGQVYDVERFTSGNCSTLHSFQNQVLSEAAPEGPARALR
jgi:hypothetical protein